MNCKSSEKRDDNCACLNEIEQLQHVLWYYSEYLGLCQAVESSVVLRKRGKVLN